MTNANSPVGLRPIRHRHGSRIVQNPYSIAAAYATKIHRGTIVELTGTSMQIQVAAADNPDNLGVFAGCEYNNAQGKRIFSKYWPADSAATEIIAHVWDDPQLIFEAQYGIAAGETPAVTDLGTGIKWVVGTGSDVTGLSGLYLDHANKATTNTQLRLERLVPRDDNTMGDFAKFEVSFMEHALGNVVAGVGAV